MNSDYPKKEDFIEVNNTRLTFEDIHRVVEEFYGKVATHRYLKIPFNTVEDWPYHIEKLTHFWWIRFGGKAYMDVQYNPVQKHFETGFSAEFLDMWLTLFKEVLNSTLTIDQSKLWFMFAEGIGNALSHHNELMVKYHSR
jgi:hemoglobin